MGRPLSVLYPATLPLYQRAGYARAGQQITYKLALDSIDVRETALDLVAMEPAHYEQCYHLYDQRARQSAGQLARPDWMWQRVFQQQETPSFRYLLRQGEQAEGYVVLVQGERDASLNVIDVCALTSAAARRLLTFFSTYRSMIEHVTWRGGSLDPLRYVLRDDLRGGMQRQDMITHSIDWMLRIVDVAGALGARGYPPGIHAELHFDLVDDVLPANSGRRVLHIAEGRGHVTPGGEGRIRLHTRDLAALYSGFCAPGERQTIGTLSGPPADLALAGAIFAGPRPWMPDMF
jgi:predicted acetyltransferase